LNRIFVVIQITIEPNHDLISPITAVNTPTLLLCINMKNPRPPHPKKNSRKILRKYSQAQTRLYYCADVNLKTINSKYDI